MDRMVSYLCLSVLVACASPSFLGATAHEVEIDGSRFRVFMATGGRAVEAHRMSFEMLPSLVVTLERGYRAIEQATGCQVIPGSLRGDQAIIVAQVDCALF